MSHINQGACPSCRSSDAYTEYDEAFWCFSCNYRKAKKCGKNRSSYFKPVENTKVLTMPSAEPITDVARAWLYHNHFTDDIIERYQLTWSGDRLLLPVYDRDEKLISYEARSFMFEPKCLVFGDKKAIYIPWHSVKVDRIPRYDEVVIVEDMISAIRVTEAGFFGVSIRGTGFRTETLFELGQLGNNFTVWLDSDKPGVKAAKKLYKCLGLIGTVSDIGTPLDPKGYSNKEIREMMRL